MILVRVDLLPQGYDDGPCLGDAEMSCIWTSWLGINMSREDAHLVYSCGLAWLCSIS